MAWQLIYTSAPRLLDAGRTGFGTVARHRAVSGLLASTVERFSQFARLPGHDPKRAVYSHRIITVGSSEYHVMSCLRDAGSDYTGRTNHLAHHLIAEEREVRALGASGVTPADILLAMPWLESWTKGPQYLDAADEVQLGALRSPETRAWDRLTGNAEHALLPWSSEAKKGVYLIVPPGVAARELMLESLQERPAEAWKIPFTTCLEPNDDVGDFKWIGVPAASPLRPQPGTAARLILDLTTPAQLPAPPPRNVATAETQEVYTPAVSRITELAPPRSPEAMAAALPAPDLQAGAAFESGWSPAPLSAKRSSKGLWITFGTVAAALVIGGAFFLSQLLNQAAEKKRVETIQARIDEIWKTQGIDLKETQRQLHIAAAEDTHLEARLGELETSLKSLRENLGAESPATTISGVSMTMGNDYQQMLEAYEGWANIRDETNATVAAIDWSGAAPGDVQPKLQTLLPREEEAWKKAARFFNPVPERKTHWREAMATAAVETLQTAEQPKGTAKEWGELLAVISPQQALPEWIGNWKELEAQPRGASPKKLEGLQKVIASLEGAPKWLSSLTETKLQAARAIAEQGKAKPVEAKETEAGLPKRLDDSVDSTEAAHPIHVLINTAGLETEAIREALKRHAFEVPDEMRIWMGGIQAKASELTEWIDTSLNKTTALEQTKVFRKDYREDDKLTVSGNRLELNFSPSDGLRLVATDRAVVKAVVQFELRVKTPTSSVPELLAASPLPEFAMEKQGNLILVKRLEALVSRFKLVAATTPQWFLTGVETAAKARFQLHAAGTADSMHIESSTQGMGDLDKEISTLKKREQDLNIKLKKDQGELTKTENSKLAGPAKETSIGMIQKSITASQTESQEINFKLTELEAKKTKLPLLYPEAGIYALEVEFPQKAATPFPPVRLCKVVLKMKEPAQAAAAAEPAPPDPAAEAPPTQIQAQ